MKRPIFFSFLPIFLSSCSAFNSIFSPIQTIKCKKKITEEYPFVIDLASKDQEIIFNKNTGELFFYDNFFETLIPLPENFSSWNKSTIVNGKLKINRGNPKVWGKATIDLKDLTGTYLNDFSGTYKNKDKITEWDLQCLKSKNRSTKITREKK